MNRLHRSGTLLVMLALLAGISTRIGAERSVTPSAPLLLAQAQESPSAWQFDDDEETTSWSQILGSQAVDLALFTTFASLALFGFFRKSVRWRYVTMLASIAYLGIYKSQLISVVNLFALASWNLPVVKYSLFWYLFAGFTMVSTVLWGRLYCGRICAFGSMTQLLDRIVPARLRYEVPASIERRASYIKYVLLASVIVYFLVTRDSSIYRYVEPFWMFSGRASATMWVGLGVLLVATVFVKNLYCRFLCPVGAFLGLLSNLTVFRIKRWSECKSCKICEKTCEWGAIQGPKIIKSECVRCDDCERLYMDQKKCPHWIIIRKKSDVLASMQRAGTLGNIPTPS